MGRIGMQTFGPRTKVDVWKLITWYSFVGTVTIDVLCFICRWIMSPVHIINTVIIIVKISSSSSNFTYFLYCYSRSKTGNKRDIIWARYF